jgi:N utilization substance protein B
MAIRSRRKAREAALRALYEIEIAHSLREEALKSACNELELTDDQRSFARRLVAGFAEHQAEIDNRLAKLIREFDFDRVAAVDRNVLRIAAYELLFEPAIPPRVSINEAVEIAKLYSTAESGRFVNGVLAKLLQDSPKAHWDPSAVPAEEIAAEEEAEAPEEVGVELIEPDSEEAVAARKFGSWTVRTDDGKHS